MGEDAMKAKVLAGAIAAAVSLLSAPLVAAEPKGDDIMDRIISVPAPVAYRVDGLRDKPKVRSDPKVQGGKALRVEVPGKAPNTWAVAVAVPVNKPVKAGDKLVLAFWARLEKGENGATSTTLPFNGVQLASAPYTPLFNGPITIGPEWKLQQVEGKANASYPAGALSISLHLATAKQVVDIGPVFLLDMGQ
jgi:hypothetical protein